MMREAVSFEKVFHWKKNNLAFERSVINRPTGSITGTTSSKTGTTSGRRVIWMDKQMNRRVVRVEKPYYEWRNEY